MTIPIQPVATPSPVQAVNPVITIQPVGTTIPGQGSPQGANPLAAVATGTLVEGFVVNRDAQNNPILRTPLGDLRITSEVFLKTGSEVVFRVDTSQASLARIVTVDGLSPQDYSAQSARGITQDTITPSALQPPAGATPAANAPAGANPAQPVLQAIVLQPVAAQEAPSPLALALSAAKSGPVPVITQLTQLKAGAPLQLNVLDVKLPPVAVPIKSLPESATLAQLLVPARAASAEAPAPQQPGATNTPAVNLATPQPLQGTAAAAPALAAGTVTPTTPADTAQKATAQAPLPQSAAVTTGVARQGSEPGSNAAPSGASPAPPFAQPAAVAAYAAHARPLPSASEAGAALIPAQPQITRPSGPNQVIAHVIGHDADGANIVHTPFASLKIYTSQPLPTGTQLLVEAHVPPSRAENAAPLPQALAALAQSAAYEKPLPGIGEALQWLQANQPDVARDAQATLPNIGRQFVSHVLNYLAGIQAGDTAEIIGKRALRLLELSAPDILSRLRQQVEQVQTGLREPALSPWSSLPLPLLFLGQLHIAQLYIQRDPPRGEDEKGAQGHGQRFILEVEMSQLGPMQFDGFVRKQQQSKSFDLMVRTDAPLADEISRGIRDIFANSMEATRMRGQVVFQHGSQHFVRPMSAAPRKPGDGSNTILA